MDLSTDIWSHQIYHKGIIFTTYEYFQYIIQNKTSENSGANLITFPLGNVRSFLTPFLLIKYW